MLPIYPLINLIKFFKKENFLLFFEGVQAKYTWVNFQVGILHKLQSMYLKTVSNFCH